MATYTLTVQIDDHWISHFNKIGYKLCLATSVVSGDTGAVDNFNVISATSKNILSELEFQWTEEYAIAASHISFSNGVKVKASTKQPKIEFGQSWTLNSDWTITKPKTDKTAPFAGFEFFNNAADANCVLFKKVNNELSPIYVSAAGPLPPGVESLVPKLKVRVWFAASVDTAMMISNFMTTPMTIDYTGTTTQTVAYDANGVWAPVSNNFSHETLAEEMKLLEAAHVAAGHHRHHENGVNSEQEKMFEVRGT